MGSYFDDSDLDFAFLFGDFRTVGSAIVSIVMILICAGLICMSHDECSDHCSPQVGRIVDHECYCVQPDGTLKVEPAERK